MKSLNIKSTQGNLYHTCNQKLLLFLNSSLQRTGKIYKNLIRVKEIYGDMEYLEIAYGFDSRERKKNIL